MGRQRPTTDRQARVAAIRAEERRKDRRGKLLVYGTTAALVAGLVTAVAIPVVGEAGDRAALEARASAPIDGVVQVADLSRNHVEGKVTYDTSPPVGGDHHPVWLNCGVYDKPVPEEHAVHSLEHGSVWITYDPALPAAEVTKLTSKAQGEAYVLVSPYEGQKSPIVLTAWGHQLGVDTADDQRIDPFLVRYLQGEQTPEPGAVCHSGIGSPAA
ncbi:MAG: DUF3105 domain-containing protein [Intrasporangium sp.]|uniref:DUF3105 domain-containing protein n=1 Tax=Intrasporangium sp. TaxID=1925024 RepID=UPI003F814F82